mmetsp:Transcript_10397/g.37622  ORF Transcript_10397/g.37622 Transcript_10397/m.37622 type:complete len:307 (-) Transcript_10397:311-1231(-)
MTRRFQIHVVRAREDHLRELLRQPERCDFFERHQTHRRDDRPGPHGFLASASRPVRPVPARRARRVPPPFYLLIPSAAAARGIAARVPRIPEDAVVQSPQQRERRLLRRVAIKLSPVVRDGFIVRPRRRRVDRPRAVDGVYVHRPVVRFVEAPVVRREAFDASLRRGGGGFFRARKHRRHRRVEPSVHVRFERLPRDVAAARLTDDQDQRRGRRGDGDGPISPAGVGHETIIFRATVVFLERRASFVFRLASFLEDIAAAGRGPTTEREERREREDEEQRAPFRRARPAASLLVRHRVAPVGGAAV